MSDNYFVPLPVLLPQINGDQDIAIERLQQLLQAEKHINQVHLKKEEDVSGICIHYNPTGISLNQIKALVTLAGAKIADRFEHTTLRLSGMDCRDCANVIEHTLKHKNGVLAAKVSYSSETLRVEIDKEKITLKAIIDHLDRLGYTASLTEKKESWFAHNYELLFSLLAGSLLLAGWLLGKILPQIGFAFILLSYASGGFLTARDSIQTLLQKRFDIDVLMFVAAIGAASIGAWSEGALLLFLFSLGHALEHRAMDKARNAVKALSDLAPKVALVKREGGKHEIPVEELIRGDIVIVRPGQRIPADGNVQSGTSSVDQAPITGESIPVDKREHDPVFAGTINGEGTLHIHVTTLASETTLSRMVRMVLEADTQKSPTQRFTDRFVRYFAPTVIIGALLLIFIPPLLFHVAWGVAFYKAMAVLVAASPCALAIATPASVLSGVARAAQKGVLIKGGLHLENLSLIQAIAFDKTGTLTQGKPEVQTIMPFEGTEDELLQLAASVEHLSAHPLAKTIVTAALEKQLPLLPVHNMQSVTGRGIQGDISGQRVTIGNVKLFDDIPDTVEEACGHLLAQGLTVMIIRHGESWRGLIGVADAIRPEAADTIAALHQLGIKKTIMLTGDNQRVAQAIADKIGIDTVKANLLPEEKLNAISALEKHYEHIAMVGDGVNDAPAMARATIGIAMGGAGTDVALEAADIALMADDLSKLPFAIGLSRRAYRVIRQNLWISLGVVAILLIATLTGFAGIGLAVFIHEGSTLFVVANALRLLRH